MLEFEPPPDPAPPPDPDPEPDPAAGPDDVVTTPVCTVLVIVVTTAGGLDTGAASPAAVALGAVADAAYPLGAVRALVPTPYAEIAQVRDITDEPQAFGSVADRMSEVSLEQPLSLLSRRYSRPRRPPTTIQYVLPAQIEVGATETLVHLPELACRDTPLVSRRPG